MQRRWLKKYQNHLTKMLFEKKDYNSLIFFSSVLFILLPFSLITGPFLSDLSVTLISIFFILYVFKEKKFELINNNYFYFFLLFWSYLVINSLFNNFNFDSVKISIGYIRFGIFIFATIFLLDQNPKILKWLFYVFCLCFICLIFDGFIQYFLKKNLFNYPIDSSGRVSSFFGTELILGSYLSRLYPIFFGLAVYLYSNNKKIIFLISSILVFVEVLIFLSGERSAFFYLNLSAAFIILFSTNLKQLRFITLVISLILIFLISHLDNKYKKRMVDLTLSQIGIDTITLNEKRDISSKKKYIFSKQHHEHIVSSMRMFEDNKFFGVGVKNFRKYCKVKKYNISPDTCSSHPHNTYIQILSETGIVGFVFVLVIFIVFIKNIFQIILNFIKKKKFFNDFQICLLAALSITIWPLIPTGNFFNNWLSIIYYFPVGIFLWSIKGQNQSFV